MITSAHVYILSKLASFGSVPRVRSTQGILQSKLLAHLWLLHGMLCVHACMHASIAICTSIHVGCVVYGHACLPLGISLPLSRTPPMLVATAVLAGQQ